LVIKIIDVRHPEAPITICPSEDNTLSEPQTKKPHLHPDYFDPQALQIIEALQRKGHTTYAVGGCVRDLLLGRQPKDFDIGTTASPSDVKRIVPYSFIIGKRFRLVLVKRQAKQFEVATFRREVPASELEEAVVGDNYFGSPRDDASRRDFTVNGMFYDPIKDQLIDYSQGLEDLRHSLVRMIGDPRVRLDEDPIRIMRALRLAHMVDFSLDFELRTAMQERAHRLPATALPRRREEFLKWLRLKNPAAAFLEAFDLGLIETLAPRLHTLMSAPGRGETFMQYLGALETWRLNTDDPLELFGALMLAYVRSSLQVEKIEDLRPRDLEDHPEIIPLMREELGMFKHEQSLVLRALLLPPTLAKAEEFQRRSERRRLAVLRNEAFGLGYLMARHDYMLSAQDLKYWEEEHQKLLPQLAQADAEGFRGRRR
jgi:poly(A) polymerase